jgi:hypothetical protein
MVSPNLGRQLQAGDEERARLQLLAVHAALRRFRWQYDRVPDHLEELRLGDLIQDPFTGKPLCYQRKGDDYELYSAGPAAFDANGQVTGKSAPINLLR